jgi:hypothetical protein
MSYYGYYALLVLPSLGLGFAVLETALFYISEKAIVHFGYRRGVWDLPKSTRTENLHRLSLCRLDRWLIVGLFTLTAFITMVHPHAQIASVTAPGLPALPVYLSVARQAILIVYFPLYTFVVTLFVTRFVVHGGKNPKVDLGIAALAALLSLLLERFIATVVIVALLVWFVGNICLFRHLRNSRPRLLTNDYVPYYFKDIALISLIFVLAVGGYTNLNLAKHFSIGEAFIGAQAVSLIAMVVLIWEYRRNARQHGIAQSIHRVQRDVGHKVDSSDARVPRVQRALLDHIMLRDTVALLVFVVAPFVISLLVTVILSKSSASS